MVRSEYNLHSQLIFFLQGLECLDEIICMFLSKILNLKVIKNEGEEDRSGFVPQDYGLNVTCW